MIEPTESEDLGEIERFISAMILIAGEIQAIADGQMSVEESALRHAPHTDVDLLRPDWDRKYSRETAGYPAGVDTSIAHKGKYWPSVGRIDGVYGDRNLVCSCAPITDLAINS